MPCPRQLKDFASLLAEFQIGHPEYGFATLYGFALKPITSATAACLTRVPENRTTKEFGIDTGQGIPVISLAADIGPPVSEYISVSMKD